MCVVLGQPMFVRFYHVTKPCWLGQPGPSKLDANSMPWSKFDSIPILGDGVNLS